MTIFSQILRWNLPSEGRFILLKLTVLVFCIDIKNACPFTNVYVAGSNEINNLLKQEKISVIDISGHIIKK